MAMTTCPHTLSQSIFALPSRTSHAALLPGCRLNTLSEHSTNQMPESTATIFCRWQMFPVGTYSRLIAVLCSPPRSRHRPLAVARPREATPTTSLNINGRCPKTRDSLPVVGDSLRPAQISAHISLCRLTSLCPRANLPFDQQASLNTTVLTMVSRYSLKLTTKTYPCGLCSPK